MRRVATPDLAKLCSVLTARPPSPRTHSRPACQDQLNCGKMSFAGTNLQTAVGNGIPTAVCRFVPAKDIFPQLSWSWQAGLEWVLGLGGRAVKTEQSFARSGVATRRISIPVGQRDDMADEIAKC